MRKAIGSRLFPLQRDGELNEMTDESLMFDIDILEKKYETTLTEHHNPDAFVTNLLAIESS